MVSSSETLVIAHAEDGLHHLVLNRPAKRNALDLELVEAIHSALDNRPSQPHCLVLSSRAPGVFAAGVDLRELAERDASAALQRINVDLFDRIAAHRWPSVAIVEGHAVGAGCELALACDLRIASRDAQFALPETSLGVIAGAGGLWRLPAQVGSSVAKMMLFAGKRIDSKAALACGLVDDIDAAPLEAGLSLARTMASRSWRALELTKLALREHERRTTSFDVVAQALLFDSDDKRLRVESALARAATRRAEKESNS